MRRFAAHLALASLATAGMACRSKSSPPAPAVFAPALALVHVDPADNPAGLVLVSLQGSGLGPPSAGTFEPAGCGTSAAGAFVVLQDADGSTTFRARSTDAAEAIAWGGERVLLAAPPAAASTVSARLCAPGFDSGSIPAHVYAYDHFDVPPSSGTNAAPLAVAADAAGRLWLDEEFHTQLKTLEASGSFTQRDLPQAAGPGIFAQTIFGDTRSPIATLGEAITLDPAGRVWFTESGPAPYGGPNPNHSRVVAVDPLSAQIAAYNVPGDDNGVVGIAWDAARGRIWFTQARRSIGAAVAYQARLTSFDPALVTPDGTFDFAPVETCQRPDPSAAGTCSATLYRRCLTDHDCVLAGQVCPPGGDDRGCFHEYELPNDFGVALPSHLLVHSDGSVWYSAYWGGNHVGRLDPGTGSFRRFPLPDPDGKRACDYGACACFGGDPARQCSAHCCQYLLLGWGPWSLVEEVGGGIAFCGQTGLALGRIDAAHASGASCGGLDAAGRNPCVQTWRVPGSSFETDLVHSIAVDAAGKIWITWSPDLGHERDPAQLASVGYLDPATGHLLVFPPPSRFAFTDAAGGYVSFGGAGVTVDPSGAVWFADYFRHRLGRLRRL